jgi:hypothetical protein
MDMGEVNSKYNILVYILKGIGYLKDLGAVLKRLLEK